MLRKTNIYMLVDIYQARVVEPLDLTVAVRADNFDMTRKHDTKLLGLGLPLTGLDHKRVDLFILLLASQPAGHPHPPNTFIFYFFFYP